MTIRTAILGFGRSGGSMHAAPIAKNPAFKVVAVCDALPENRTRGAERFGCPVYADHREMLAKEKLDLVCVVTRNHEHAPMSRDCLAAGVNVLVTKPWAVDAAEAETIVAAARKSGKQVLPWLPTRWGCELRRLRELLAQGAIGKVFMVRRTVRTFATRNDWQTERRYAGGYLLNWGPHIVDPPLVLLGGRPVSVFGRLRQTINPGDAEDLFLAVITLADGAIVQVEHTVSAVDLPGWVVQGDRGTITLHGRKLRVCRGEPTRPKDPTAVGKMAPQPLADEEENLEGAVYGDEHEVYAEVALALRGEKEFPVRPADALGLSRVLDAIRLSSEEDRVVKL